MPIEHKYTLLNHRFGGCRLDTANMRVLVTGGAGFIGSNVCKLLIENRIETVCMDDLSNGTITNLGEDFNSPLFTFTKGDIRSREDCHLAMNGCTHVCHLAARPSVTVDGNKELFKLNVEGTRNLLMAASEHEVSMFVFSSSCAVYGDSDPPLTVEHLLAPISNYGESKMMAESLFTEYPQLKHRILRYFNVYGPCQRSDSLYAAVIPIFTSLILSQRAPTLFGGGNQTRDFIHVRDVARANMTALFGKGKRIQNIGSGEAISIEKILGLIQNICAELVGDLIIEETQYEPARDSEIIHSWCGDSSAATISIEAGLKETISWLREEMS